MTDDANNQPPASPSAGSPPAPAAPPASSAAAPPAPPAPAAPAAPKADPLKAKVESRAVDLLHERFADQVVEVLYHAGDALVRLRKDRFLEIARMLRDDQELRFDYLSNLTAVHWPQRPQPFEMVYHLFSITKRHRLTLKMDLGEGEEAPTASVIWPTANWHEREVFDLFGIRFSGHPDLTRILMTDEWVGHPLRKDYPLEGKPEDHLQYREVTTAQHVYTYEKSPIRGFGWKKEIEKTGVGKG
ncbi:MAG TPA: NADH-quinone oxidoreductase subunit C [Candidatus Polarisedimenticolia bacterium]